MADTNVTTEAHGIAINAAAIQSILDILSERDPANGLHVAIEALVHRIDDAAQSLLQRGA